MTDSNHKAKSTYFINNYAKAYFTNTIYQNIQLLENEIKKKKKN